MKRTQSINLFQLRKNATLFRLNTVTIAILAASLSGCDSRKGVIYNSLDDCKTNLGNSHKCEQQYQQARSIAHQNLSPFSRKQSCEEKYGAQNCEQTSRGYFPYITSFLSSNRYGGSPLFRDKYSNNFMSLDGTNYGSTPGKVQIQRQTVSRGGFGANARRSSGWSFGG